jgi:hypothetical protein
LQVCIPVESSYLWWYWLSIGISKCVILCAAGLLLCLSMQWIFASLCNHKQLKGKRYLNLEIICLFGVGGYQ